MTAASDTDDGNRAGAIKRLLTRLVAAFAVLRGASTCCAVDAASEAERVPEIGDDRGILQVDAPQRYLESKIDRHQPRGYTLFGRRRPPIPSFTGLLEPAEEGKIGIACSGGGIRSAAFSLGALQVLQREEKLENARYLAGVSGGSYIAAAFSMVRKTWEGEQGASDDSDPEKVTAAHPPFFPGSPEEQYLRNRSSYMAQGAFGKLQFGYRLVLGMGVNGLFIVFAVVTAAVPLALLYGLLYPHLREHVGAKGLCQNGHVSVSLKTGECHFVALHIPCWLWVPIAGLAAAAILVGGLAMVVYRLRGELAEGLQVWSLQVLLLMGIAGFVLIAMPVLLSLIRDWGTYMEMHSGSGMKKDPMGGKEVAPTAAIAGAGGTATLVAAVLLQLRADWGKAKILDEDIGKTRKWWATLPQRLQRPLAYAIAAVVGPALLLGVALFAMTFTLNLTRAGEQWILVGALAVLFILTYFFADMTSWSLHSFYRRRLCSAFALKRVARPEEPKDRSVQEFPAIASTDSGMAVERDYHHPVKLSQTGVKPVGTDQKWPTLLVCAAANISDDAATPPGRAVTSFTFSATAIGGPLVGAVETEVLENSCDPTRLSYLTLPAAVAMSGAAISPSMGKLTRRPLRFLMTLANVRLGVWVPNPRRVERFKKAKERRAKYGRIERLIHRGWWPRPRAAYLLRELLGINSINSPYLYVTDGGHYENLGLVELLRRGCTEIYVFDASNDDFAAIGDAVSLARSELNVEVDVNYSKLVPAVDKAKLSAADCVEGTITYPDPPEHEAQPELKDKPDHEAQPELKDKPDHEAQPELEAKPKLEAKLYYARLTMTKDAPADVIAYAAKDPRFPHDSTTDQLYTDQRFEAYRALGAHAAKTALQIKSKPAEPQPVEESGGPSHIACLLRPTEPGRRCQGKSAI